VSNSARFVTELEFEEARTFLRCQLNTGFSIVLVCMKIGLNLRCLKVQYHV
jgi:hypothetical protein